MALRATDATVIDPAGKARSIPVDELAPAMVLAVAAGERLAADGEVLDGRTELDKVLDALDTVEVLIIAE